MLFAAVLRQIKSIPALKKVPGAKLQTFSLEICLVALGLRSGYLFDTFSVRGNQLEVLCGVVQALRRDLPAFKNIVLLHEQHTDAYFFISVPLLLERCKGELQLGISPTVTPDGAHEVPQHQAGMMFVSISPTEVTPLSSMPERLAQLLRQLYDTLDAHRAGKSDYPPSIMMPAGEDMSATDVVPLAAVLIEYPVAYIPQAADQSSFLSGVELEVYSCILVTDMGHQDGDATLPDRHTVMQFSCPRTLLPDSDIIVEGLRTKFTGRLESLRTELPCHLEITSRTERLDRVAL
ncbi:hypothetical protein NM688_g6397 [Phlebia brevispora]|uniref:Uncharacterized protein n=1 Tax=Phlebia brevispora TaxID=194682 RepID=A0ACC1SGN2_9APHY|nr:hypothetical protein NM688_g6397 [Phlebia brevispora]